MEPPTEAAVPETAAEPPKQRRTRRRARTTTSEPPAEDKPVESAPETGAEAESAAVATSPARRRRARRKKPAAEHPSEPEVASPDGAITLETPPEVVIRHPVAQVQFQRGVPSLRFGERALKPCLFFGNPHTPEAATRVHQQMQLASEAGIALFALLIVLPVRPTGAIEAFDAIRYWSTLAREINPDALMLWRVVPAPVGNWQQEFPEAVVRYADGTVGGPSVCADRWWEQVQMLLTELVQLVEREDEGACTLGYHLDWGEWFQPESGGYDTSEAALQAFRDWLRRHFRNDTVSLRAGWFSGEVSFSTAAIPPFIPNAPLTRRQLYDPRREGRWIDYHQFISEATARRILSLAGAIKQACHRRCLVGVSYGYVLEWRHPYSGHLALASLLQSDDIDFISAPITYADRLPGGTGAFPVPADSLHLHQKLFLSEEDYRTPFGKLMRLDQPATEHTLTPGTGSEEDYNPPLRSAEAVAQVQTRSLMQAVVHGFGESWMDLWGDGWLMHPAIWERVAAGQSLWELRERVGQAEPDLAVVIDPLSLSYARTGSPLIQQVIGAAREAVLRSGISCGFYLLDDVARRDFPRSRIVLFLNAWNLKPSVREAIRRRLHRDGRVLVWLYAASLFENHRHALETAREVTGLALALQPWASTQGTQIVDPLHPIARRLKSDKLGTQQRWEPSFYALPDECHVIGEYIETGLPSLAVAEYERWKAVFIGEQALTPDLLRGIADWAGVHVWCATDDLVQVRLPLVHLHARRGGEKSLQLPMPLCVYDLTEGTLVADEVQEYRQGMSEGESRLWLIAPREAMERWLSGEGDASELRWWEQPIPEESPAPEAPDAQPSAIALVQPLLEPTAPEEKDEPIVQQSQPPRKRRRARNRKRTRPEPTESADLLQTVRWRKHAGE